MAFPLGSVLSLISGVPIILLGGGLLSLRPRRSKQIFFGLFAVLWGTQVVTANLGLVTNSAVIFQASFLVSLGLLPPAYLFLSQFAARTIGGRWAWLLPTLTGGIAAVAGVILLTSPDLVLMTVQSGEGGRLGRSITYGPAAFPLFWIPFFGVFYLALGVLYLRYRWAPPGSPRYRYRQMVLALALYTSYQTITNLVTAFGWGPAPATGGLSSALSQGLFLVGTLVVAGLVAHLWLDPPAPEGRDPWLLAAFLVPAGIAVATELFNPFWPEGRTWGLWRILTVAVLVHAIARYQLFDLDLKVKRWAAPAIAALLLSLAGLVALVTALGDQGALLPTGSLLAGGAAAGMVWSARAQVGQAFLPGASEEAAYVRQRKREVYQAALAGLLTEPSPRPRDLVVLAELRESLGISQAEHEALAAMARPVTASRRSGGDAAIPRVEAGATLLDRYRVDRLLGEGGHGRAFLAYDEQRDEAVVLKVVGTAALGGKAAALLRREAEVLGGLDHPHIIAVHDIHEAPQEVLLVLEYAAGGSLAGLLDRRTRLGLARATELLGQVLAGLEAAHEAGVVHRDVKPENVLLTSEGTAKLADFGIARPGDRAATAMTAGPVGTLLYASPEQLRGREVTPVTDLYSAGVLFHRMLTGRLPFRVAGLDDFQLRRRILEDPPELRVGDHPTWVRELLARALAKDPDERFQSAGEMASYLPKR